MATLNHIDRFVVLMLENRSFDNLLGWMPPGGAEGGGLSGEEYNIGPDGKQVFVTQAFDGPRVMWAPTPDPGEKFVQINEQLFRQAVQQPTGAADMSGFVQNYAKQPGGPHAADIMHYFKPEQVPALSALARSYAVCDRWFAAAPCQTWPNRFFVHTGTANGYENNSPAHFPYLMPTIFDALEGTAPHGWKVYFHDFPQSLTLTRLWDQLDRFRFFDEFLSDAKQGTLPSYSFIEPRFFADLQWPNDMHPPHNVGYGDALVAQVYNALRQSPNWASTLLVITFDEHGGCYDHVVPPTAPPPEPKREGQVFGFDRMGVRVPAIVVSPYIQPGTVFRAPAGNQDFDHTAIIATLRKRFGIAHPLTARDATAPDLEVVLNLDAPQFDGREAVTALPPPAEDTADALNAARLEPLNDFQEALHATATHLEPLLKGISLAEHLKDLFTGKKPTAAAAPANRADAIGYMRDVLNGLGVGK